MILIHPKNQKINTFRLLHLMTNLPTGEVGSEPRSLYGRAVSATASLTAKYVACG